MEKQQPRNIKTVKYSNLSSILNIVKHNEGISRIGVSELTGLSAGATSALVNELIEHKLLIESGEGASSGGRKPILLKIREDSNFAIGIDLSEKDIIAMALINLAGQVIGLSKIEYSYGYHSTEDIINMIKREMTTFINPLNDTTKILGIGIAVAGILNEERNNIAYAIELNFDYESIVRELTNAYGLPVFVENDIYLEALAENEFGAGKNVGDLFYLSSKSGIGGGIILDNKIYHGRMGGAGEIGRIIMDLSSAALNKTCGGRLEEFVTEQSIRQKVALSIISGRKTAFSESKDFSLEKIEQSANDGDLLSIEIIKEVGTVLGILANTIISFFSVPLIVVGGSIIKLGPQLIKVIDDTLKDHLYKVFQDRVSIVPSFLKDNATLVGASSLITQKVFNSPELILEKSVD